MKQFWLTISVVVAVCQAELKCDDRLKDITTFTFYNYSESMSIEDKIKIMKTSQENCKKGKTIRVSLFQDIKECLSDNDLLEEAKTNASRNEEQWCGLKGK